MVDYYRPTTVRQKIRKIIQLHTSFVRAVQQTPKRAIKSNAFSICMIVPQLDRIGGYERQALLLAKSLSNERNLVTLLSDRIDHQSFKEFRSGFLIYRLPKHFRKSKFSLFISLLAFLLKRRHRYQIIHIHGVTGYSLFALWIAKRIGLPVVIKPATKDDLNQLFLSKSLKHRAYGSWLRRADKFVAISQELKQEILSCGIPDSRVVLTPNFVDTDRFKPCTDEERKILRKRFSVSEDQVVFLYVGRLEKRKSVDVLLEAWKRMSFGVLWIVGEGPEGSHLRSISLDMERVTFFGATEDVLKFYQAADVFVFPSMKEGFPNVLLEAMSCGLPCIASDIGGVTELISDDREGFIVPKGSSEKLSAALLRAAESKEDRMRWGKHALNRASDYEISAISKRYLALYSELSESR